jgi:hypothetical protein
MGYKYFSKFMTSIIMSKGEFTGKFLIWLK